MLVLHRDYSRDSVMLGKPSCVKTSYRDLSYQSASCPRIGVWFCLSAYKLLLIESFSDRNLSVQL